MKTYNYCSDSAQGTIQADSIESAFEKAKQIVDINDATIEDGAFVWVEDEDTGKRIEIGKPF